MFDDAFKKKNFGFAVKFLEQAAKETGGSYTNKREIEAKVDADVTTGESQTSPEVSREMLASRLREAFASVMAEKTASEATPPPATIN